MQDIILLFVIKSIKLHTNQFDITNYINFSSAHTRSNVSNKLMPPHHLNNNTRHSYFHFIAIFVEQCACIGPEYAFLFT